jgi:hypothetical protein
MLSPEFEVITMRHIPGKLGKGMARFVFLPARTAISG